MVFHRKAWASLIDTVLSAAAFVHDKLFACVVRAYLCNMIAAAKLRASVC
jgi:hypothetical protein